MLSEVSHHDITNPSMISVRGKVKAIISVENEYLYTEDFFEDSCTKNCYQMCFKHTEISQKDIYKVIMQTKKCTSAKDMAVEAQN